MLGKNENRKKFNDEHGMVAVETIIAFTTFVVTMAGLIYFINIFTVHNRVQFAINSAAHEISSYSYFYEALGLKKADAKFHNDWAGDVERIDDTTVSVAKSLNKISNTYDSAVATYDSAQRTYNSSKEVIDDVQNFELSLDAVSDIQNIYNEAQQTYSQGMDTIEKGKETVELGKDAWNSSKESTSKVVGLMKDPQGMLAGMVGLALFEMDDQVKSYVGAACAEALTEKYLVNGNLTADQYLRSYGVVGGYDGLDFSESSIFKNSGNGQMVDIVVQYDIHIGFLGLLIADPTVHVVQRVSVPGWLDGDGVHAVDKLGI